MEFDYNSLLAKRKKWLDEAGQVPEDIWREKGIEIHRSLIPYEPENIEYKTTLAKILVDVGWDEKMIRSRFSVARDLFNEALQQQPNNWRAHYHLGFLESFNDRWASALGHFEKALANPAIELIRKIKALSASAICESWLGNKEKANELLKTAWNLLGTSCELAHEVRAAELQIKSILTEWVVRPLILITKNGERAITFREAEEVESLAGEDEEAVLLDLHQHRPVFTGPIDTVYLEPKVAQLLLILMANKGPVPRNMLLNYLWPESSDTRAVRQSISKLRTALERCYSVDIMTIVSNSPDGWVWADKRPFYIIQPAGMRP